MSTALLIVDVQNDFTEGGALGVDGGNRVAAGITRLLHERGTADDGGYALVAASRDWHNAEGNNGGHFADPGTAPDFVTSWPRHCVAGTPGAAYHEAIDLDRIDVHLRKGQGVPDYSAFQGVDPTGRGLAETLANAGITALDVVGIATDYCVRASALDALAAGLRVRVLTDLVAGVATESSVAALKELAAAGVEIRES